MSTPNLNSSEDIRKAFQKLFEKTPEEQIEHRALMLSYIFLSEVEKTSARKGWTRKKLAAEIGTSPSYLTQLFRGDRLLNFKTIAKIEQALGIRFTLRTEEIGNDKVAMVAEGENEYHSRKQ